MRKYYIGITLLILFSLASYGFYYVVTQSYAIDQQTEQDIGTLNDSISKYTDKNKHLPQTLSVLDVTGKKVAKHLRNYTYKPIGRVETESIAQFEYQLCATFKKASKSQSGITDSSSSEYQTYLDTSSHPAGQTCFKMAISDYSPVK